MKWVRRGAAIWLALWGLSLQAGAAGVHALEVPAGAQGRSFKAVVWSPCEKPGEPLQMGPFVLQGVRDCPLPQGTYPLVVVSHGHGGSALSHRDTAEALANEGFVVAALNHPGDAAIDMRRSGDMSALLDRPADVSRLLDFMLGRSFAAAQIDARRIGFFGFSRGGFTGLVLGGARPDFMHAGLPCVEARAPLCRQMREPRYSHGEWAADERLKAFVIADPLNAFPGPDRLRNVKAPVQLWLSEYGGDGVAPERVAALANDLPTRPDVQRVPRAGHFAFLAPCPQALARSVPDICSDAPGFSRESFHQSFNASVLAFFRQHLAPR